MPMLDLNTAVIATWPAPDYENPTTRGPAYPIVGGVFFFFATVCVWLRLYSRWFIRRWFGLDDWLILAAYVCAIHPLSYVLRA